MLVLFDLESEVNAIRLTSAKKLNLSIQPTNIKAQKIDNIILNTYKIVVIAFSVTDKVNSIKFFKQIFLIDNVSLEIVFEMLFFILNNANIDFLD